MNFQDQTLLPSQETLLQRLYHAACYNEQLTLISGVEGAGKTTLITALVSELEEYNTALVTCPLHADDAEIRRKILVQLLTDPLFDDEVSLTDTILRLGSTLIRPLHIVIDDADHLTEELWAELMILSKLKCADKPITITMTVMPESMALKMAQLSSKMKEMILPITIESLSIVECEALYQTLLSRSEQVPFTPREIVRAQLKKQKGTPLEVVSLINLALYGEQSLKKKSYIKRIIAIFCSLFCILSILWWLYLSDDSKALVKNSAVTAISLPSPTGIASYGDDLLKGYFSSRRLVFEQPIGLNEVKLTELAEQVADEVKAGNSTLSVQLQDAIDVANVKMGKQPISPIRKLPETLSGNTKNSPKTSDTTSKKNQAKTPVSAIQTQLLSKPEYKVYTLQLANLNNKKSLQAILDEIKGFKDIFVMKKGRHFIVFQGNFKDEATARIAAKKVVEKTSLAAPWLRKWQQLEQYQLLKHYPDGEITQ